MTELHLVAVSFGGVSVPLADWLAYLHRRGRLVPLLREAGGAARALARQLSVHPPRSAGVRLGLLLRRTLPPAVAEAVFAAKDGALVGPIATPQGFSLFVVEKLLPATLDAGLTAQLRK